MRWLAAPLAGLLVGAAVHAAAAPASPMEQCTQQWLDLKAAGKTGGQVYRLFLTACLKTQPVAAAPEAKPSKAAKAGGAKRPNRMSVCAAKWRQMKAQNTTHGMTYRQWDSQCLRGN